MKKSVTITVRGRVQGVGFRYHTRRTAFKLNINGYIKNQADGSVYIEAEGDETDLDHFIYWCRQGPAWARVDDFKLTDNQIMNYPDFSVR